VLVLDWLAV
jgi:hypothetical protein